MAVVNFVYLLSIFLSQIVKSTFNLAGYCAYWVQGVELLFIYALHTLPVNNLLFEQ